MCSILTASDLAQCTGGLMFSQIGILIFYFISCSINYTILLPWCLSISQNQFLLPHLHWAVLSCWIEEACPWTELAAGPYGSGSGWENAGSEPDKSHMGIEDHLLCRQSLIAVSLSNINFHWQQDYLVGLNKWLWPHVELCLWWRSDVASVAVEEWVGAMASHSGRVPVLNNPRACSNPTAWENKRC